MRPNQSHTVAFDMTPMVDVVLLLIIFFLYTSQLTQEQRTAVDLPFGAGQEQPEEASGQIVIDLPAPSTYFLQGQRVSIGELFEKIDAEIERVTPTGVDALIRADRSTTAATMNEIARGLSARGVNSWRIATMPGTGSGGVSASGGSGGAP